MPTLVATAKDPTANAYLDVAGADAYHDERLHNDEWLAASDTDKARALIWATRQFEQMKWRGMKTTTTQALLWPRSGVLDLDQPQNITPIAVYTENYLDDQTIPTFLARATAELALFLLREDRTEGLGAVSYEGLKVGSVDLQKPNYQRLPPAVTTLINPYLQQVGGGVAVATVRT